MKKTQHAEEIALGEEKVPDFKQVHGIVVNVQVYSLHDGPGVRTNVFFKGCPLRCKWCCNPECIRPGIEVEFYKLKCVKCGACLEACSRKAINPDLEVKSGFKINRELCNKCGECVIVCPNEALKFVGEVISVNEVLERVRKDKYFYLASGGGLTISGGEPLYQFEFTHELLRRSWNENIDTAMETCGYAPWHYYEEILPYLNTILFDIKSMDPMKHKEATGVSDRLILSNLRKISQSGIPIIIRLPLIPHFNTDQGNITQTAEFISSLNNVREVNLMPFHQLGKDKYVRLSREYALKDLRAMMSYARGTKRVRWIKSNLESYGLDVTID